MQNYHFYLTFPSLTELKRPKLDLSVTNFFVKKVFLSNFVSMRRLFVTDLDGTLLGNDSKVSDMSARIVSRLSDDGVLISIATARTPATVEPLLAETSTSIPAVVITGAAMWDRQSRRFFNVHTIPHDMPADLIHTFVTYGVSPFVYTLSDQGNLYVYHSRNLSSHEKDFYINRAHLRLKKFKFLPAMDFKDMDGSCILMLGIAPIDKITALAAELRSTGAFSVTAYPDIFMPHIGYIEVFAGGVSKAKAVLELKEMVGADSLTVYGDNLNDIPMLKVADEAVAVSNALDEVREVATRVIGPNCDSSVALDIQAHFR